MAYYIVVLLVAALAVAVTRIEHYYSRSNYRTVERSKRKILAKNEIRLNVFPHHFIVNTNTLNEKPNYEQNWLGKNHLKINHIEYKYGDLLLELFLPMEP